MGEDMKRAAGLAASEGDKFKRFEGLLFNLGKQLVADGICQSYRIEFRYDKRIPNLILDNKPMTYEELPNEVNSRACRLYDDLVKSCGITDEEYDESYGGLLWDLVRTGEVNK